MKPINCYADALCTMHYARKEREKRFKKKTTKQQGII
jgi:hypothetical protein